MSDFEERLRQALRPLDPGEDFTARVLARVAADVPARPARRLQRQLRWLPVALAASLVAVIVMRIQYREREIQGLEARRQLIEALEVTSQKLDLAYRIVNTPPAPGTGPVPGAG
jgi:hypothetical protein